MAYFVLMSEMRGCYSDNDSAHVIRCQTRRELKSHLESMADVDRDQGAIGLSKRDVAALAALAWRKRKEGGVYPYVQPFRYPNGGPSYGLFVYPATRAEYLEQES